MKQIFRAKFSPFFRYSVPRNSFNCVVSQSRAYVSSVGGLPSSTRRMTLMEGIGVFKRNKFENEMMRTLPCKEKTVFRQFCSEMGDQEVIELNYQNFVAAIKSPTPVLIECYSDELNSTDITQRIKSFAEENKGAFQIARLNVANFPEIAQQMQVQELPTLYSCLEGRLINRLEGIPSDFVLKQFINELVQLSPKTKDSQGLLQQAETLLTEQNIPGAAQLFNDLLSQNQLVPQCLAGLARCALAEGNTSVAQDLIQSIRDRFSDDLELPEVKRAIAAVSLAGQSSGSEKELLEEIQKDDNNLQAKYDLAVVYFQTGRSSDALELCFAIIKKDKYWNNQGAKRLALEILEALGPQNPLTKTARRRLSNLLFV